MKEIKLTQGKVAQISDHRFEYYNQWEWHAHKDRHGKWYAIRSEGIWPFQKKIKMHRQIMGVTDPKIEVDHRDSDGLNNADENLRKCTHAENTLNRGKQKNNKSGFKGVGWHKHSKRYRARIQVNGKMIDLGYFIDPIEAAHVRDEAAKKYHGEFAHLNFPD